jgi:hypothetical protein
MNKLHQWLKLVIIVLLTVLVLTPGFYRNEWLAAGKKWFYDWRKLQEHMVIARLVQSRQGGIFAYGGLLGFGNTTSFEPSTISVDKDYQTYLENGTFQSYYAYTSNPGAEGMLFGLFSQLVHFSPAFNLKLFHGAVSLLSALMLGLFIYWVVIELGWISGFLTLLFIASSEWMTLFGGNIFWNLWAFYLPLVVVSFYLMNTSISKNYRQLTISILVAMAIFVKCLFNGFEYFTTALLMPLIPFIFYAIRDSWGLSLLFNRLFKSSIGLIVGMLAGLLVLVWQIVQVTNSSEEAGITLLNTIGRRTFGDASIYTVEAASLNAKLLPVLMTYINGRAILFSQILRNKNLPDEVSFLTLFILFIGFTVLLFILRRPRMNPENRSIDLGLIVSTWAAALAPLSWFILFKSHSYFHTQMNYIIWQMPFTLFGFALCGYTLQRILAVLPIKSLFRFLHSAKGFVGRTN